MAYESPNAQQPVGAGYRRSHQRAKQPRGPQAVDRPRVVQQSARRRAGLQSAPVATAARVAEEKATLRALVAELRYVERENAAVKRWRARNQGTYRRDVHRERRKTLEQQLLRDYVRGIQRVLLDVGFCAPPRSTHDR